MALLKGFMRYGLHRDSMVKTCNVYNSLIISRPYKMNITKAKEMVYEDYDDKNIKLRPMSPFMVQKFTVNSVLSISHRITGGLIGTYFMALGGGYLVLPYNINQYVTMAEGLSLAPELLMTVKLILAFPFCYHCVNGTRHLIWDCTGNYLTMPAVYSTGYLVIGISMILTGYLSFI